MLLQSPRPSPRSTAPGALGRMDRGHGGFVDTEDTGQVTDVTQCRAQVLPRSHPHLGAPTIQRGACRRTADSSPACSSRTPAAGFRVQPPRGRHQRCSSAGSRGAKQALLSSPELLLSLPPSRIRCPQLTADPEPRSLGKPAAETTHLQLRGSHPENIDKTGRQHMPKGPPSAPLHH